MGLIKRHISQILVHILFWSLFVLVSLFLFSDFYWRENPFLQYVVLLVILVYVNHFFLLPYFVKKKFYSLYLLLFAAISFLATQLYCYAFAQCGCSLYKCLSDYLWQTLVPLIFFSFVWVLYRFIEEQETVAAIKKEHTEMELKFLKSQINPHVLFNNLNTIYSYAIEKPTETPDLILMLSNNLKHVLYESNEHTIALEKEIEYIDNYIKFQQLRTEGVKRIMYTKTIDNIHHKIAPLLLITIIENAFKHSTLNSNILLDINVSDGVLTLTSENNYDANKVNSATLNIGLQNLEKRLQLIYNTNFELVVVKAETFKVTLEIKLQ